MQALVRWGGAMLELAHFKQGSEADDYIKEVRAHTHRSDNMGCDHQVCAFQAVMRACQLCQAVELIMWRFVTRWASTNAIDVWLQARLT